MKTTSASSKRTRKRSAWDEHLSKVRKDNPGLSFADAVKKAKASYTKGEKNAQKNSYTAVDLSRHSGDGRGEDQKEPGAQGSAEKAESAASPGAQASPGDQAAASSPEISFEINKVEVENPVIRPDPAKIEMIPPKEEERKEGEKSSMGFDGRMLSPFFKLITETTGLILAAKYEDPEFKRIWALNESQVDNLSDATALLINRYVPAAGENSEVTAFLLTAGVAFSPIAYATFAKISEINERRARARQRSKQRLREGLPRSSSRGPRSRARPQASSQQSSEQLPGKRISTRGRARLN